MSSPRKRREKKFRRLEERERQLQDRGRRIDVRNRKNKEEDDDFLEQIEELAVEDSVDEIPPWNSAPEEKVEETENLSIQDDDKSLESDQDGDEESHQEASVPKKKKRK
jgi:hypothetical protein